MGVISGLPYPEGTDLVTNGDDAIKALATAVARNPASLVANVATLALSSGWANLGTGVRYIVINGMVWIYGRAQRASGSNAVVAAIPPAAQPFETFRIQATNGVVIAIGSQLTVDAGNTAGALNFSFATSYPANAGTGAAAALADTEGSDDE
jgi:hypothetical protein